MASYPAGILLAMGCTGVAGLTGTLTGTRLAGVLTLTCLAGVLTGTRLARILAFTSLTGVLAGARLARLSTSVLLAVRRTGLACILARAGTARLAAGNAGFAGLSRTGAISLYGFGFFAPFRGIHGLFRRASGHAPAGRSQADVEIEFIVDLLRGGNCAAGMDRRRLPHREPCPPKRAKRRVSGRQLLRFQNILFRYLDIAAHIESRKDHAIAGLLTVALQAHECRNTVTRLAETVIRSREHLS
jgi:hypothetical protein